MTIITPARRRMKRRIAHLPQALHDCTAYGIWVRRPRLTGKLVCLICGRP